jgi:hypothetical protein
MIGFNGGLIGKTRTTTANLSVPGVWTANEQIRAKANALWPSEGISTTGLILHLDAGKAASYPGTGTTWTDLSIVGNNGTLTNGPTFDSGDGGSIVFDGDNDHVALPLITAAVTNVTLQCWVYLSSSSKKGIFIGIGTSANGHGIGVGSGTNGSTGNEIIGFIAGKRYVATSTNYGTGWKFVTWLLNASSVPSIYVGSTFIGLYSGSGPSTPTTGATVGAHAPGFLSADVNIAQVIAYNRALSAAEIETNFDLTKGRYGL